MRNGSMMVRNGSSFIGWLPLRAYVRHGRAPAAHGIAEQQDRTPLPDQAAAEPVSRSGGTCRSFASAPKSCFALAKFQTSAEPSGVDFPPAIGAVAVCGW